MASNDPLNDPLVQRTLAALMADAPKLSALDKKIDHMASVPHGYHGMTFQEMQEFGDSLNETEALNLARYLASRNRWVLTAITQEDITGLIRDQLGYHDDLSPAQQMVVEKVSEHVDQNPGLDDIPDVMHGEGRHCVIDLIDNAVLALNLGDPATGMPEERIEHVIREEIEIIDEFAPMRDAAAKHDAGIIEHLGLQERAFPTEQEAIEDRLLYRLLQPDTHLGTPVIQRMVRTDPWEGAGDGGWGSDGGLRG